MSLSSDFGWIALIVSIAYLGVVVPFILWYIKKPSIPADDHDCYSDQHN